MRGATEFAVVFAVLSFALPGRGLGLAVLAALVGFAVGLLLEIVLNRTRAG